MGSKALIDRQRDMIILKQVSFVCERDCVSCAEKEEEEEERER
jgi:hypothetical protein